MSGNIGLPQVEQDILLPQAEKSKDGFNRDQVNQFECYNERRILRGLKAWARVYFHLQAFDATVTWRGRGHLMILVGFEQGLLHVKASYENEQTREIQTYTTNT